MAEPIHFHISAMTGDHLWGFSLTINPFVQAVLLWIAALILLVIVVAGLVIPPVEELENQEEEEQLQS